MLFFTLSKKKQQKTWEWSMNVRKKQF